MRRIYEKKYWKVCFMDYFIFNSGRCILSCDNLAFTCNYERKSYVFIRYKLGRKVMKNLVIKICAFMILITLF